MNQYAKTRRYRELQFIAICSTILKVCLYLIKKSLTEENSDILGDSRMYVVILKIKSVAYSSQGDHIGQLDFCNRLADGSMTGSCD